MGAHRGFAGRQVAGKTRSCVGVSDSTSLILVRFVEHILVDVLPCVVSATASICNIMGTHMDTSTVLLLVAILQGAVVFIDIHVVVDIRTVASVTLLEAALILCLQLLLCKLFGLSTEDIFKLVNLQAL